MKTIEKGLYIFAAACFSFLPAANATSVIPSTPNTGTVVPAPSQPGVVATPVPTPSQPGGVIASPSMPANPAGTAVIPAPGTTLTPMPSAPGVPVNNAPVPVPQPGLGTGSVPTANTGLIPPAGSVPTPPPQGALSNPSAAQGSLPGTNVMGATGVPEKHSGTYYDSEAILPDYDLATGGMSSPRKVDPANEPGQKYVVVKSGPSAASYEAQFVAATRALKLNRYAAAMEMFEKLYKKNHKDPRILMGLAVAQQGAGFTESAANTYSDLLDIQPNNADAIVNLMGIMKNQYPSVTLKRLTELRNKYPMNPGIPAQMGLVNAEMKNYDEAMRYFEIAASMEPRNASHVYNMAIVADHEGNISKAIKLYENALQLDSSLTDSLNTVPREQIYDRLAVLRRKV